MKRILMTLVLAAQVAHESAVVSNGDFSDPSDLAGFTATGDIMCEPTGEFGQLETDGSFIRTLEQTINIPAVPSTLSFDFAFSTEGDPSIGVFPDSFAVSLITTLDGDFLDILVVDAFGVFPDPSDGIEGITGATPIDVSYDSTVGIPGFGGAAPGRVVPVEPSRRTCAHQRV